MTWNWAFSNSQRATISIALGVVLLVILLANWFVSYTMQQIDHQFKSVYQDRLVPASYMSDILERYYQNQLLLEQHIQAEEENTQDSIQALYLANTTAISAHIQKFETTYLTEQETLYLQDFKQAVLELQLIQEKVLTNSRKGNRAAAHKLLKAQNRVQFQQLLTPLHSLISLQEKVGYELYQSADRQVKSLKVLSYIVIALAVTIALIIGTLLQANRRIKFLKPQKFHLN